MSEVVKTDDHETIEVVVIGTRVDAVRISNRWRDRYDALSLAETFSMLIREALPSVEVTPRAPRGDKHLPIGSIPGFIAELQAGSAASNRYVKRLRAGEVERLPLDIRHLAADGNIEVAISRGRFKALYINPSGPRRQPSRRSATRSWSLSNSH